MMSEPAAKPPPIAEGQLTCKQVAELFAVSVRTVQLWMKEGLKWSMATIPGSPHPAKVTTQEEVETFARDKALNVRVGGTKKKEKAEADASIFTFSATKEQIDQEVARIDGVGVDWVRQMAELRLQLTAILEKVQKSESMSVREAQVLANAQKQLLSEIRLCEQRIRQEEERAGCFVLMADADRTMEMLGAQVRRAIEQIKGTLPSRLKVGLSDLVPEDRQADVPRVVAEIVDAAIEEATAALADAATSAGGSLDEKSKQVA